MISTVPSALEMHLLYNINSVPSAQRTCCPVRERESKETGTILGWGLQCR